MLKKIHLTDTDALLLWLLVLVTLLIACNRFDDRPRWFVRLGVLILASGGALVFLWRRARSVK